MRTVAGTGSTNADMLSLARAGEPEGTWLRADRQSGGRGREGRRWISPVGNYHGSTLIRLRRTDPPAATLALATAVAAWEAVAALPGAAGLRRAMQIKWPNDLTVGTAKLAGMLLERADDAVVIGIGVNLAHHPATLDRPATSLAEHGVTVAPEAFGEILAEAVARWLARWRGEGLGPIRSGWLERAHPVGTALIVRPAHAEPVQGLFDGLDSDGALLLRLAGGERRVIHAGDVFLL